MAKKAKSPFRGGHKHIHQEDAFTRTIQKIYQFYVKSPFQAIVITIAAIGIIVIGSIFISNWTGGNRKPPPKEAAMALFEARSIMDQDPMQAEQVLRDLNARYNNTLPGQKAHFYLGQVLYYQERFNEALTEFEEFESNYKVKKSFLRPAALYAQGNCLECMQLWDDAINRYLELPEKYPESGLVVHAKLSAGRCMRISGQFDRAEGYFEEMLEDYPEFDSETRHINFKIQTELGKISAIKNVF